MEATDIFQEGIQLRTVKLWNRGRPVPEMYRIIEDNTRFPAIVLGDVDAQLAGCLFGRELFEDMIAEYGLDTITAAIEVMWKQSDRSARDFIARMPDGQARTEVGRLASAINVMLDRIADAFVARGRSEARVRDFAADASHELRTPLAVINSASELLLGDPALPLNLRPALRRIQRASRQQAIVS